MCTCSVFNVVCVSERIFRHIFKTMEPKNDAFHDAFALPNDPNPLYLEKYPSSIYHRVHLFIRSYMF